MTQEEKARAYDEALERARKQRDEYQEEFDKTDKNSKLASILRAAISAVELAFPELVESEDEKIIKALIEVFKKKLERGFEWVEYGIPNRSVLDWLEKQKEQKPIKMEVYEVGNGTTICGQDYKCKKDYQVGNCKYIKDAIYHCGRDGYLTDQNGVSWSCTPEWFKEYIQSNTEWAEEEKTRFVSEQFLQCKLSFDGFKEGEYYWLEYIGDDMYVGRSDNILNQKFHITPRQLYTLFSQKLEEVQGPPQEEKQISLNYELPFNENPSDIQIIEALIKHLKEQDGFLTAIDCVSTKSILSWLEKQKEEEGYEAIPVESTLEYKLGFKAGKESEKQKEPKQEWSDEDEYNLAWIVETLLGLDGDKPYSDTCKKMSKWIKSLPERFVLQPKQEWDTHDKAIVNCIVCCLDGQFVSEAARKQSLEWFNKHRRDFLNSTSWKPAEWSEEDEKDMAHIIRILDDCYVYGTHDLSKTDHENLVNKLKSLRPSWKPNEEQMKALYDACCIAFEEGRDFHPSLSRLYHDLMKL